MPASKYDCTRAIMGCAAYRKYTDPASPTVPSSVCTLTFVSHAGRLRLVFNRDELRTRPAALSPVRRPTGVHTSLMPIDPVSDGTWIGVNSAGLLASLMNSSAGAVDSANPPKRSRGVIVPHLLQAATCREAAGLVQDFDPVEFAPFRTLFMERYRWCMAESDGKTLLLHDIRAHVAPLMFASSGLGDHLVDPPRRELFNEIVERGPFDAAVQDAFHDHVWAERRELSVRMSRAEAHTVSRTVIELTSKATMMYEDLTERAAPVLCEMELVRSSGSAPS